VLLTHEHFDHIRDIPTAAFNFYFQDRSLNLVCTKGVKAAIIKHLFNKTIYPQYHKLPLGRPAIAFSVIRSGETRKISGYKITSIPVRHTKSATGFLISDSENRPVFFSADTSPGFLDNWRYHLPQTIITEVTMPDRFAGFASQTRHLTPQTLADEISGFIRLTGHKPNILVAHMHPLYEQELKEELNIVAAKLDLRITIASEDITLVV
jgi:ribonuclease BN (tRNA processing enzyme)